MDNVDCPLGTIGTYGVAGCTACPPGSFQSNEGCLACNSCPAGMVSGAGARECKSWLKGITIGIDKTNYLKPGRRKQKKTVLD